MTTSNDSEKKPERSQAQHILVATDFSACAQPALDYAAMLATRSGATLHLLYVSEVPGVLIGEAVALRDEFVDADIRQGRVKLDETLRALRERGIDASGEVRAGFAARTIVERARQGGYELVVIGTHGRNGFDRFWMGSVAEKVVRGCPIPVVTIRGHSAE